MSHLPFAIAAYFLNSVSVLIDKFLLTKHITNPLVYVFYFSAFSVLFLIALPFTHLPSLTVFALASTSTMLWTTGAYFLYLALRQGQPSRVIPIVGTLNPVLLLIHASYNHLISQTEQLAVVILIIGMLLITLRQWQGKQEWKELLVEVLSASFFAASYLVLRQAYLQDSFLTVLIWSRTILVPVGIIILIIPALRRIVLSHQFNQPKLAIFSKTGVLFFIGQASGGLSEMLLVFAVSLATPALVNSLQGTQYFYLLIFSFFLAKKYPQVFSYERSITFLILQILGISFLAVGLYILAYH